MEFLPALPADLVAVADPSARGPAPLLRSGDAEGSAAAAAMPFADFLALLTAPLPAGESWPATGKDLPVIPVEPAGADPLAAVPDAVLPLPPFGAAVSALPTPLPSTPSSEGAALPLTVATATPTGEGAAVEQPPLPSDDLASTADVAAPTLGDLEPAVALAAAEQALEPLDGAALEAATVSAKSSAAPSWLEAFTLERRLQRPAAATAVDPRAAIAQQAAAGTPAAAAQPAAAVATPTTEAPQAVQALQTGVELPKLSVHGIGGADSASVGQPDWLPAASPGTTTASASATTTPAVPGAPVDTRSPNWQEAFANRVQWVVDQQAGEAHIKLNPPELGAVDVKISLVDDKTYVQLTTATAAARDELAQSLPRLRELFTFSGLELGGASVHNGWHGHQAGNGYGAEPSGSRSFGRLAEDRGDAPVFVPRRSAGRIDVFA